MFCLVTWGADVKHRPARTSKISERKPKPMNTKGVGSAKARVVPPDPDAAAKQQQLKSYEEGLKNFQEQKFLRAKQCLERVLEGPTKELRDRAMMHMRICDQRISRPPVPALKSAEDHYTQGVALMNLGRWDESRSISTARGKQPRRPITSFTPWQRWTA